MILGTIQVFLGYLDKGLKRVRFFYGELGEYLPVYFDVRFRKAVDEPGIREAVGPGRGVYPLNPEFPEFAFPSPAVFVLMLIRFVDGVGGRREKATPPAAEAFSALQYLIMPFSSGR